ncbi:MAG TPA: hypothetical protein VN451_06825 [Chitinophagaceae bacterium]|nr:hypothetical protein [Chitinophagaceae bacterium]
MKKIFACIALLIVVNSAYSQQNTQSATPTKQSYLKKAKNQKAAAWVLMGSGIVLTGLGTRNIDYSDGNSDNTRSAATAVLGVTCVGVSTALFILATKNKKKAETVGFKMEKIPLLNQKGLANNYYPAISFRINL